MIFLTNYKKMEVDGTGRTEHEWIKVQRDWDDKKQTATPINETLASEAMRRWYEETIRQGPYNVLDAVTKVDNDGVEVGCANSSMSLSMECLSSETHECDQPLIRQGSTRAVQAFSLAKCYSEGLVESGAAPTNLTN
jgi:hypothetical protein